MSAVNTTATAAFSEISAVSRVFPGRYRADIEPLWGFGGNPNGGYLQATMARAALDAADREHVLAASTHFLAAPGPGDADIDTVVLRAGKSTTQVRVTLSQGGEPKVEALVILGVLPDPVESPRWQSTRLQPAGAAYEECVPHAPDLEQVPATLMHQIDLRMEPASLRFYDGEPQGIGELRGWIALPAGEEFDSVSLLFAADVMPPATYDVAFSGWVPTLTMSTYIRAVPVAGPLQLVIDTTLIQGGKGDETCTIRDSAGTVVAQAHQLAGVRLP
ncbi:thioesterase family protein [Gordonia sp. VNK21]|uniref:thioesterase family protein n=1 Tax=Gordonia sp. VNK21 TaxID=3382483 RepID=UPI0038D3C8D5